jgi:hypothetical protein
VSDEPVRDAILERNFVLWPVTSPTPPPALLIGRLQPGAPVGLTGEQRLALERSAEFPDQWTIAATDCGLVDDQVYHYWFEVPDAHPGRSGERVRITDPLACTVGLALTPCHSLVGLRASDPSRTMSQIRSWAIRSGT